MAAQVNSLPFVYRIDADDIIIYVNHPWIVFAKDNGAASLAKEVLGSLLWDHLCSSEVVTIYRALVRRAREEPRPRTFLFRCDSPTARREMKMTIEPLPNHHVEFRCHLLREEPHEAIPLLDTLANRSAEHLRMCAWCLRVKLHGWLELEEAISILGLLEEKMPPQISHGICERCKDAVLGDLANRQQS